jgi:hypothetical protein
MSTRLVSLPSLLSRFVTCTLRGDNHSMRPQPLDDAGVNRIRSGILAPIVSAAVRTSRSTCSPARSP